MLACLFKFVNKVLSFVWTAFTFSKLVHLVLEGSTDYILINTVMWQNIFNIFNIYYISLNNYQTYQTLHHIMLWSIIKVSFIVFTVKIKYLSIAPLTLLRLLVLVFFYICQVCIFNPKYNVYIPFYFLGTFSI